MWLHRRVARLQMRRQRDADRRWLTALLAPPSESQTHGGRMRHIPLQRLEDGVTTRFVQNCTLSQAGEMLSDDP